MLCKASVGATNRLAGRDTVLWQRPSLIDTVNVSKGPYQFKVFREDTIRKATKLVYTTPFSSLLWKTDTTFIDSLINTVDSVHTYRVEFFDNGQRVGSSPNGSTVFLKVIPSDRMNALSWIFKTPWTNVTYRVEYKDPSTPNWTYLADVITQNFSHLGITNGVEYCYRVISSGTFNDPSFKSPIINYSQEVCSTPLDLTPPCPPDFAVVPFCAQEYAEITWNNTLSQCNADVEEFQLYYSATQGGELKLFKTFKPTENRYIFTSEFGSIAGCFAFGAIDKNKNQSFVSQEQEDRVCIDNCPDYVLPNVFTPNADGKNDFFVPFPYHGIESIDAKIYNRWGKLLFETTDPELKWDGKAAGKPVPDGVYFYVVLVNKITLKGKVQDVLKGTVTIFAEPKPEIKE